MWYIDFINGESLKIFFNHAEKYNIAISRFTIQVLRITGSGNCK